MSNDFNYLLSPVIILALAVLSIISILIFQSVNAQNPEVSYLDVNNTSSVSKFSVAAWFKTSNDYTSDAFIVNKDGDGGNMNYGIWMNNAEKIQAGFETSNGKPMYATSPLSYSDGKWHYVVVTFDGSIINLYIDGIQVASKPTTGTPDNGGAEPVRLGADSKTLNDYFIGEVDEIRVWSSALTAQQVIDATNAKFDTKDQIMYLDFSEPLNQTATVNGTTTNATAVGNATATNVTTIEGNGTATNGSSILGNVITKNETSTSNETGENQTAESISPKNNSPEAYDQSVSVDQNGQTQITLVGSDKDSDPFKFDITADPLQGSLDNFDKEKGTLTYVPQQGYSGNDKFNFRVVDDKGSESNIAQVDVNIKQVSQSNETQETELAKSTSDIRNQTSTEQTSKTNLIEQTNKPPKADAGDDQKIQVNTEVKLDGSKSSDEDGNIVSYKWEQTDGPKVDLKQSDEKTASFDVPESAADSKLSFQVTVVDDKDASGTDDVTIQVENAGDNTAQKSQTNQQTETNQQGQTNQQTGIGDQIKENIPPKADAGGDQKAEVDTEVKLDGSKSSDEDGKIVSYKWEQTDGPKVDLKQSDEKIANFNVPPSAEDSKLVFKLTVVDEKDASNSDDVTVEVQKIPQTESDQGK